MWKNFHVLVCTRICVYMELPEVKIDKAYAVWYVQVCGACRQLTMHWTITVKLEHAGSNWYEVHTFTACLPKFYKLKPHQKQ